MTDSNAVRVNFHKKLNALVTTAREALEEAEGLWNTFDYPEDQQEDDIMGNREANDIRTAINALGNTDFCEQ